MIKKHYSWILIMFYILSIQGCSIGDKDNGIYIESNSTKIAKSLVIESPKDGIEVNKEHITLKIRAGEFYKITAKNRSIEKSRELNGVKKGDYYFIYNIPLVNGKNSVDVLANSVVNGDLVQKKTNIRKESIVITIYLKTLKTEVVKDSSAKDSKKKITKVEVVEDNITLDDKKEIIVEKTSDSNSTVETKIKDKLAPINNAIESISTSSLPKIDKNLQILSPQTNIEIYYSYITLKVKTDTPQKITAKNNSLKGDFKRYFGKEIEGVKNGDYYFIYNVPLANGSNSITVTSKLSTKTITINSKAKGVEVMAIGAVTSKDAKKVTVEVFSDVTNIKKYYYDYNNDGRVDKISDKNITTEVLKNGSYKTKVTVETMDNIFLTNNPNDDKEVLISDDITAPVIELLGDNPLVLKVGDSFNPRDFVSVSDDSGDNVSLIVNSDVSTLIPVITGKNNPSPWEYNVWYTATDRYGNRAEKMKTVYVKEDIGIKIRKVAEVIELSLKNKPTSDIIIPISICNENGVVIYKKNITIKLDDYSRGYREDILTYTLIRNLNLKKAKITFSPTISNDSNYDGIELEEIDINVDTFLLKLIEPKKPINFITNYTNEIHVETILQGNRNEISYELIDEPEGMKIDRVFSDREYRGVKITWKPPQNAMGEEYNVKVRVINKSFSSSVVLNSSEVILKVKVIEQEPIETIVVDNEMLVVDKNSNLRGLRIKSLDENVSISDAIKLFKLPEEFAPAVPDNFNRVSDFFTMDELVDSKIKLILPENMEFFDYSGGFFDSSFKNSKKWFNYSNGSANILGKKFQVVKNNLSAGKKEIHFIGFKTPFKDKDTSIKNYNIKRTINSLINCKANDNSYSDQTCTYNLDKDIKINVKGFGKTKNDTLWHGTKIEELAGWLINVQKWFDSMSLDYDKKLTITINKNDIDNGNYYPKKKLIELSKNTEHPTSEFMRSVAIHEYFHNAQVKSSKSNKPLFNSKLKWITEGSARWFEDYVYDYMNTYKLHELRGKKILSGGLNSDTIPNVDSSDYPYRRFSFFKLLHTKCGDIKFNKFYKEILNIGSSDPSGIKKFKVELEKAKCDFGNHLGTNNKSSLMSALLYYQYATVFKNDIELLDPIKETKDYKFERAKIFGVLSKWENDGKGNFTLLLEKTKEGRWAIPPYGAHSIIIDDYFLEDPRYKLSLTSKTDFEIVVSILPLDSKNTSFVGDNKIGDTPQIYFISKNLEHKFEPEEQVPMIVTFLNPTNSEVKLFNNIKLQITQKKLEKATITTTVSWTDLTKNLNLLVDIKDKDSNPIGEVLYKDTPNLPLEHFVLREKEKLIPGKYPIYIENTSPTDINETMYLFTTIKTFDENRSFMIAINDSSGFNTLGYVADIEITEDKKIKIRQDPIKNSSMKTTAIDITDIPFDYSEDKTVNLFASIIVYISQVTLGPISDGELKVYDAIGYNNQNNHLVSTTTSKGSDTLSAGIINMPSEFTSNIKEDKLYLLKITGGEDIDRDDNRKTDNTPTKLNGSLHSIISGSRIKEAKYKVNILTEIAYQVVKKYLPMESKQKIQERLDEVALKLLSVDFNHDYTVNREDLLSWIPYRDGDKSKLLVDYEKEIEPIVQKIYDGEDIYRDAYGLLYMRFKTNSIEFDKIDSVAKPNSDIIIDFDTNANDFDSFSSYEIYINDPKNGNKIIGTHSLVDNKIIFNPSIDLVAGKEYKLIFIAKIIDENSEEISKKHSFEIKIEDIFAPELPLEIDIYENSKVFTVETIEYNTPIEVQIIAGDDKELIEVKSTDENNFTLEFKQNPNSEKPHDYNSDNIYNLILSISDSLGNEKEIELNINIVNVDEVPILKDFIGAVSEDDPIDTLVGKVEVLDYGESNISRFILQGDYSYLFDINISGYITLKYNLNEKCNSDIKYELTTYASNIIGDSNLSSVSINVGAVNSWKKGYGQL